MAQNQAPLHYPAMLNPHPIFCYLEVAETNSVVVEIPKLLLACEQVRDELVNVNKMPTNLEGSVVESAFFGVFSKKTAVLLYLWRTVE